MNSGLIAVLSKERWRLVSCSVKPRLHERFLPRAGDAIFFRFCRVACAPGWVHKFWEQIEGRANRIFKGPGHYKQTFLTSISLAKYSLVASQARTKSCRVATRATISAILSQKFQLWRLFSCDFSLVASPVQGWLQV